MICRNCQTFYVRDPCPNCGNDSSTSDKVESKKRELNEESVKPSQVRKRETSSGSQILMQKEDDEERLVKPSERFRKEEDEEMPSFQRLEKDEQDKDEQLVKPSERARQEVDDDDIPSFQRFQKKDDEEQLVKPSERRLAEMDEDDIPSFQRYQRDQAVDVSNISMLNRPEQQEKLKNDEEYRNKVKETLEEVMGLLEKLIDEE